jgi:hypothetical protein
MSFAYRDEKTGGEIFTLFFCKNSSLAFRVKPLKNNSLRSMDTNIYGK